MRRLVPLLARMSGAQQREFASFVALLPVLFRSEPTPEAGRRLTRAEIRARLAIEDDDTVRRAYQLILHAKPKAA